jgi:Zn-dependent protease with chaperone function
VLISDGLVSRLCEDELRVIVAHEFAHVGVYRDTLLAILTPFVATLTMTGQSAVLGLLDYRRREFRADQHAADVMSSDVVMAALRNAAAARQNEFVSTDPGDGVGILPTPAGTPQGGDSGPFSPIFDSVGVTEAHPSIDERVAALLYTSQGSERQAE